MKKTEKMDYYIGMLVRLMHDIRTGMTGDGRRYREGRVFRIGGHWRGKLHLYPPNAKACPPPQPTIRQAEFSDVEEVREGLYTETGFCRVCGCIDEHGCEPDEHGQSCSWVDQEHTLCSRCFDHVCNERRRKSPRHLPIAFLQRLCFWHYTKAYETLLARDDVGFLQNSSLVWLDPKPETSATSATSAAIPEHGQ